ncbi:maleylpyruvate isomerase N-terminal domain-containing protein [Actinomadura craniellae]|nr:maleylpyruvate isomerase N-terminal domain-containing protein [Actinomadura craniellae]
MWRESAVSPVMDGFRAEAERLAGVLSNLPESGFDRPTSCEPWTVRELVVHVTNTTERVAGWLAEPEPATAEVDAVGYYRPDRRFSPESNAVRVADARRGAGGFRSGHELAGHFDQVWRAVDEAVRAEPPGRRISTRWDDAMLLTEFMVTRVAELVLHGLDLARALDRAPWTTDEGGAVVERLLVTAGGPDAVAALGWDRPALLARATGRAPLTPAERQLVRERGVRWLALG